MSYSTITISSAFCPQQGLPEWWAPGQHGCKSTCCLFASGHTWAGVVLIVCVCVCVGNCSSPLRQNPNRKTTRFSDWLHMECLQRPAVHLGWLSSFFKAIWSLLKLSLFKEPAERGESTFWVLGEKEEMRCKVANRCGRKSGTVPCLCSGCSCWLSCSLLRWFLLQKNHLPRHRESGNLLCLFFGRPRAFSFLTNLSCHWNLHSSCFSFIFFSYCPGHTVSTLALNLRPDNFYSSKFSLSSSGAPIF